MPPSVISAFRCITGPYGDERERQGVIVLTRPSSDVERAGNPFRNVPGRRGVIVPGASFETRRNRRSDIAGMNAAENSAPVPLHRGRGHFREGSSARGE